MLRKYRAKTPTHFSNMVPLALSYVSYTEPKSKLFKMFLRKLIKSYRFYFSDADCCSTFNIFGNIRIM